jgi:hypothetical protein
MSEKDSVSEGKGPHIQPPIDEPQARPKARSASAEGEQVGCDEDSLPLAGVNRGRWINISNGKWKRIQQHTTDKGSEWTVFVTADDSGNILNVEITADGAPKATLPGGRPLKNIVTTRNQLSYFDSEGKWHTYYADSHMVLSEK